METPAEAPSKAPSPPDWSEIHRDIFCPLCEYNLRGLSEPRCPECGHRFVWAELLDEHGGQHPWLFEYQRKRRIRSLFRTLRESYWPTSFWTAVRPSHRPRMGRLVVYWLVLTIPLTVLAAALIATPVVQQFLEIREARQALIDQITSNPNNASYVWAVKSYGTRQAVAAATYPMPAISEWVAWIRSDRYRWRPVVYFAVMSMAWPLVATLSFIVFRDTLRQARIKSIHVLRCAIYSADIGLILVLGMIPLIHWRRELSDVGVLTHWLFAYTLLEPVVLCAVLLWIALLTYRLTTAYRTYLGFRHALLVTLWSQIIFFILLLVIVE
jgi:hypothetical protein